LFSKLALICIKVSIEALPADRGIGARVRGFLRALASLGRALLAAGSLLRGGLLGRDVRALFGSVETESNKGESNNQHCIRASLAEVSSD